MASQAWQPDQSAQMACPEGGRADQWISQSEAVPWKDWPEVN